MYQSTKKPKKRILGHPKAKKPKRQKPLSKLKKELTSLARQLVVIRDESTCQHCFKKVSGANAHCSHVIPRSAGNKLRWDLNNLKMLCYHCHINWFHKNPIEAADWFKLCFPGRWDYLQENKGIKQFKRWELEEMITKYKEMLNAYQT